MEEVLLKAKDTTLEYVIRVTDVLLGGDSFVPVPKLLQTAGSKVTAVISSESFPVRIPHVNLSDSVLGIALIVTALPPLVWNFIALLQYYTKIPSKLSIKPIIGVLISALIIASLSVYRSSLFIDAIGRQETLDELDTPFFHALGGTTMAFGLLLLIGAFYRLGITGTYLGDYFGILRDERITAFPFNVVDNPMYDGSSLLHLGEAIL